MTTLDALDTSSLEKALKKARRADDMPRVAALALSLAAMYRLSDRRDRARELYTLAYETCVELKDLDVAEEAATQMSQMALEEGNGRDSVRWSQRVLACVDQPSSPDPRRARLLHNLAVAHIHLEEPTLALGRYGEALRFWGDGPEAVGRRSSLIGQGELLVEAGEFTEAVGALLAASALFGEGVGQDELRLEACVCELLGAALVGCGRHAEAVAPLRRAGRLWEHLEAPLDHRRVVLALAEALLAVDVEDPAWEAKGDPFKEGIACCQSFVALSRASGDVDGMIHGGWMIAGAYERLGDCARASEAWERLGEQAEQMGSPGRDLLLKAAQVALAAPKGAPRGRLPVLDRAEALYLRAEDDAGALWCCHQRVELLVALEEWEQAAAAVERIRQLGEPAPDKDILLLAHLTDLRLRGGQIAEARQSAAAALALMADRPHPMKASLEGLVGRR